MRSCFYDLSPTPVKGLLFPAKTLFTRKLKAPYMENTALRKRECLYMAQPETPQKHPKPVFKTKAEHFCNQDFIYKPKCHPMQGHLRN